MAKLSNNSTSRKEIRSRVWCFTYNNPPCDQLPLIFKFNKLKVQYVFQLEKVSIPHFQGVIRFETLKGVAFQKELPPMHWERSRSWKKAIKYCSKLESRIDGPWFNLEFLKFKETIEDPLKGLKLYDWQQQIINIVLTKPDRRTINWIYDSKGGKGKSAIISHIMLNYKGCIELDGPKRDMFYHFLTANAEMDIKTCFIDLSRADYNRLDYGAIERIKNGRIFSTKYESTAIMFNPPHIIVTCNIEPRYEMLTADRWNVIHL